MSKCYVTQEEREKIIIENQKLIYHIFKKMRMTFRIDDMFDVGLIGLIKGVDTFDSDKGYKLSTYIGECIKNELTKEIMYENAGKRQANIISFDKPIFDIKNQELTVEDTLGYELNLDENLINEELLNMINHRLYFLPERDEKIFKHSYGIDNHEKMSTKELSEKFKISKTRIDAINSRIKRILRYILKQYYEENYYD